MKRIKRIAVAAAFVLTTGVMAEQVHQKAEGEAAYINGKSAVEKGKLEIKQVKGAADGKVARVKGDMSQWGFVAYWMGVPTPDGASKIRIRVFVDGTQVSTYGVYVVCDGHKMIKKLEVPADAKPNTFVNIDLPVKMDAEWSGIILKKFEKSDKPGPWIDSITVLVADE